MDRYSAILSTPWSNVVELREYKTLNRSGGPMAIVVGAIFAAAGGVIFWASVKDRPLAIPATIGA